MEHTNFDSSNGSNPDRRVDSSRRRAEVEAANQQARQEEWRTRDAEEVRIPAADQGSMNQGSMDQDQMWQRWRDIQSTFVDDPRSAVSQAHALVSGEIERVVQQLQEQRDQLERGWSSGDDTSTEDLRRGLQGYREFLQRLLSRTDIPKA